MYICSAFIKEQERVTLETTMTQVTTTSRKKGIVSDRNSVSFSYRSPLGERKVTFSHAFIAKSASRAYARVVIGKK